MLMIQLLVLGLMLLVVPTIIGSIYVKVNKEQANLVSSWVSGQILLWAGFFVISVPMILLQKTFTQTCYMVGGYTVALLVLAVILIGRQRLLLRKEPASIRAEITRQKKSKAEMLLWLVFWALLLLQFVLAVVLAYEEGDDAFYIAIATITGDADTMYIKAPYTGGTAGLDARHGLAPFPIWIAYLARISGMHAAMVAQVILAVTILGMAYGIYYLIARHLCEENIRNLPFFMILIELLVMFGGYSVFSVENFIMVRASQGKAVLAGIVLPFLFYLLMLLMNDLQENKRTGIGYWVLLVCTTMTGCLCSTLGTVLICMLLGIAGICIAASYKRWKVLIPMALSCGMPVGIAMVYFVLR